jgi:hypothetical protein
MRADEGVWPSGSDVAPKKWSMVLPMRGPPKGVVGAAELLGTGIGSDIITSGCVERNRGAVLRVVFGLFSGLNGGDFREERGRYPCATRVTGCFRVSRVIHGVHRVVLRRCSGGAGFVFWWLFGNPLLNTTASSTRRCKRRGNLPSFFSLLGGVGERDPEEPQGVPEEPERPPRVAPHPGSPEHPVRKTFSLAPPTTCSYSRLRP